MSHKLTCINVPNPTSCMLCRQNLWDSTEQWTDKQKCLSGDFSDRSNTE